MVQWIHHVDIADRCDVTRDRGDRADDFTVGAGAHLGQIRTLDQVDRITIGRDFSRDHGIRESLSIDDLAVFGGASSLG